MLDSRPRTRPREERASRPDAGPPPGVGEVVLDRPFGDPEQLGDRPVAQVAAGGLDDVPLPGSEDGPAST